MAVEVETDKTPTAQPAYIELAQSGELAARAEKLHEMLRSCRLCPHRCGVNRLEGQTGKCRSGNIPRIASFKSPSGEERCLKGQNGSGAVYFSGCNLGCLFCQTWQISQKDEGEAHSVDQMAQLFLDIREAGHPNLNLVTPTHWLPWILSALDLAAKKGFDLPVVYNTSGYETPEVLDLLDGIVDIYLCDLKYDNAESARNYSGAADYVDVAHEAIRKIHGQVGNLVVNEQGLAVRGLIIQHLLLPGSTDETMRVIEWLYDNISQRLAISLLPHYTPSFKAKEHPALRNHVKRDDMQRVLKRIKSMGLRRV